MEQIRLLSGGSRISPRLGAPTPPGGRQHTILPKIPKNCMKLKEFGPGGGGAARPKFYYVDPPLLLNSKSTDLDWYYSKNNWKLKLLIRDFLFTTFVKNLVLHKGVVHRE